MPRTIVDLVRRAVRTRPRLVLEERRWLEDAATTTVSRSFVLDAVTGGVSLYSETLTAYADHEYRALLAAAGFGAVALHPTFGGDAHPDMVVIVARVPLLAGDGAAPGVAGPARRSTVRSWCCINRSRPAPMLKIG